MTLKYFEEKLAISHHLTILPSYNLTGPYLTPPWNRKEQTAKMMRKKSRNPVLASDDDRK
jgi:hypothetical protein